MVLLLLCASYCKAQAQNINIRSEYYSVHNGLNVAEIFKIEEGQDGMIWLATENGLLRYDAHTFKTFLHDAEDTTSLSNNYIKDMCMDKHGRLWMSSQDQLDVFDTKTFKVTHISNEVINEAAKHYGFHFAYDRASDEMWMCTQGGIFSNKGHTINVVKKEMPKSLSPYFGYSKLLIDGDVIWIISVQGLIKWYPKTGIYKTYHRQPFDGVVGKDGFFSISKDKQGMLWIGNWSLGLHSFDPEKEIMENYSYRPLDFQNAVYFTHDLSAEGYPGMVMIGTMDGLKIFDKSKDKFLPDASFNFGINDKITLFSFLESERSGLWIGTSKGLFRLDMESRFLKKVPLHLNKKTASLNIESLIFEPYHKDSILWFTGGYERLVKYDLTKGIELPLPPKLSPYVQKECGIYDVYLDGKNTIWVSSMKDTVIAYNIKQDVLIKPTFTTTNPVALCIEEDSKNNIWFASVQGLFLYDKFSNQLIKNKEVDNALTKLGYSKKLLRLDIDKNGNLWMASGWSEAKSGLVFYNPHTHVVKIYSILKVKALHKIIKIEDILITDKEILLCGTSGLARGKYNDDGLVTLHNPINDISWKGKELRFPENLENDVVSFRTKYGIINYNLEKDQIQEFNHINSNLSIEINHLKYSSNTNRLYMAYPNHIDYFNADSIVHIIPRKVILSDMSIANYTLSALPESGARFELKSHQNSIQFEFSNLSFNNSVANKYLYRVNYEKEWKKMNGNKLSFDGLGGGIYHLEVISSNCYGTLNHDAFTLTFAILPPFYQTWWFFLLCMATLGLLFYFLYRLKVRELDRLQKVRLSIARDLHDDMGSNLSYIKMLSEVEAMTNPDQTVFHTIVHKMSEVMNNMSEIIWNANPKNDRVEDVLHRIQEYAIATLEPLNVGVVSDTDNLQRDLSLDIEAKRHLYLIFKEAINNIGKYAKATKVTISATTSGKKIHIKIKDDGIGFDPLLIKRGNGLVNMQERASHLHAKLEVYTSENGTTIELILS